MSYDRVSAVHNAGVVTALVEHSHVQTKDIGNVDRTAHSTLVRADDHHVIRIDLQILYMS